jgi:hypothetical protein
MFKNSATNRYAIILCIVFTISVGQKWAFAQEEPILLEGSFEQEGGDYAVLPFQVPDSIKEIEVTRISLAESNILDFGVWDPNGFRGWSGGNHESAIIGIHASSRSYLSGEIIPGEWEVIIGKAKLDMIPAEYRIEIILRQEATLAPEVQNADSAPAVLRTRPDWYAGDFHVHSKHSGDAEASLRDIATYAQGAGLDFVVITDHNTYSHHLPIAQVQADFPDLLLIPGTEWTTYQGHAGVYGNQAYEDHRIGFDEVSAETSLSNYVSQGALVAINHPVLELGEACLGCAWSLDVEYETIQAVEIATGGWAQSGFLFTQTAMEFWDVHLDEGAMWAPIGGSDDHKAGVNEGAFQSPIGNPTTMVYATELSANAIIEGVKSQRTVVKLQGPDDPMIQFTSTPPAVGGIVSSDEIWLSAFVTGGVGKELRILKDGFPVSDDSLEITQDPFFAEWVLPVDSDARYRLEVWNTERPLSVTSHLWAKPLSNQNGAAPSIVTCQCLLATIVSNDNLHSWILMLLSVFVLRAAKRAPKPAGQTSVFRQTRQRRRDCLHPQNGQAMPR